MAHKILKSKDLIAYIMHESGKSKAWLARQLGCTPQSLNQKLMRNSLRADELLTIFDTLGIKMTLTGGLLDGDLKIKTPGHGPRAIGMADGVTYDTVDADAMANTFYADGENEYDADGMACELYLADNGKYFLVEYKDSGKDSRIKAIPEAVALPFIEKYGPVKEREEDAEDEEDED